MTSTRRCILGGKSVALERLDDVAAYFGSAPAGTQSADPPTEVDLLTQWRALEAAGYVFVSSSGAVGVSGASLPVFRRGARILLGTRRVSARLREELTEEEAEAALAAQGLTPVRRMKFAPNLFEAEATASVDPLALSQELSPGGQFLYVEPEFIELLGHRDYAVC